MNLADTIKLLDGYKRLTGAVSRAASSPASSSGLSVEAVPSDVDGGTARGAIAQLCGAYAASVRWRVRVPGNRAPNLPAQDLLAILAKHGKDLLADTGIRPRILAALLSRFSSAVPSRGAMNAVAAKVVLDAIFERFRPGFGLRTGQLRAMTHAGYLEFTA